MIMSSRFVPLFVLSAILLCAASAQALAPFGPPVADLKQGQFSLSAGYDFSETDIKASSKDGDKTIDGARSNSFTARPGYGIDDDWKIYGLIGASDFKEDGFSDGYQFAYGFGTKVTVDKFEKISWGFLFQVGYKNNSNDSSKDVNGTDGFEGKIDYYDVTLAIGPSYSFSDKLRFYGGPFLYILKGHLHFDSADTHESFTLGQKTTIGGYFGAEYDLCSNSSWYGEYHLLGQGWLFSTGLNWKF
jgi:opacity protein-like surface antigen